MRLAWLRRGALLAALLSLMHACGARTGLRPGDENAEGGEGGGDGPAGGGDPGFEPECRTALDCPNDDLCAPSQCLEGACLKGPSRDCLDTDACTRDRCDPATGACLHEGPTDDDGDGFDEKTTDFEGCGNDCDDDDSAINPAALELCDGRDNDCDDAIDEGTSITYSGLEPVRLSAPDHLRAFRGGLARSEATLGVSYTGVGADSRHRGFFIEIDADGSVITPSRQLNEINADNWAGSLVWTGEYHATAWADARHGNYEIFFNRLTTEGQKLGADLRLTDAPDFSVHPTLVELEDGFVIAWDDRRLEDTGGVAKIFGVHVASNGSVAGEQILTTETDVTEYPAIARGKRRLGLAYTALLPSGEVFGRFRTFSPDFGGPSNYVDFGLDVQEPSVVFAGDRFVVTWQTYAAGPGPSIMAAVISEDGVTEVGATAVTSGATYARTHAVLSLGDRLLLIWADDFDGNYELYSQVMSADLGLLRGRERITFDAADTLSPSAVLTSNGGVGILFDDWRSGSEQVYYTRLDCLAP